jgi:hypothetical protein
MLKGNNRICEDCAKATRLKLAEIPVLYLEASAYLEPGRGGSGSSGSERTIGVNLAALGFRQAGEVLVKLEDWERTVRVKHLGQSELEGSERTNEHEQGWKPSEEEWANERPVVRRGSVAERVQGVCEFLLVHSRWLATYDAADEFAREIANIHAQGEAATRRITERITRITCPGSVEQWIDGIMKSVICGQILALPEGGLTVFECKNCRREWTTLRLLRVAFDTEGYELWLDTAAIAKFLDVGVQHTWRLIRECQPKSRGDRGSKVYNLVEIYFYRLRSRE